MFALRRNGDHLTILSVAYPLLPAGPDSGGGAEQVLFLLDRGLVQAGYQSIVIAARGSTVSGKLIETAVFDDEITNKAREDAQQAHLRCIKRVLQCEPIDLIHFHGLDFYAYQPAHRVAKLATLHLPAAWYPESIFSSPDIQLNCVSTTQAKSRLEAMDLPVVPNGIDTEWYANECTERRHLLWLGRICPEKGVHIALQVARRLDLPMIVAGPVHPFRDHQDYFSNQVQPLLDSIRTYVGTVGIEQKTELLAQARCLLIPSLVAETSSLVAMEAISSGTPVIAFRSGALPEIIDDGRTGFIVDSEDEMANAVEQIDTISARACKLIARARFDYRRMVNGYLSLYRKTIERFESSL